MVEKRKLRYKNKPPIRQIIQEYLEKNKTASFTEISSYVKKQPIKLTSKKPGNSIYSILVRMKNVERIGYATYKLK
jgi:hypothetical protein